LCVRAAEAPDRLLPEAIVVEPGTGLMWQRQDRAQGREWILTHDEAVSYCRQLSLFGYHGWRLPTIGELEDVYKTDDESTEPIRSPLSMSTSYVWSSSEGEDGPGSAWGFSFVNGSRSSMPVHFSSRTLCVRDPAH